MNIESQGRSHYFPDRISQSRWGSQLLGNRLQILAYHSISESSLDDLTISPAVFEDQMDWLQDNGFQIISLEEALLKLDKREGLRNYLVLTFDDGYTDFFEHAVPVLETHEFKATVFVVTGKVGRESDWNYSSQPHLTLSLSDLQDLRRMGYSIGSHSMSHALLSRLAMSDLETELRASRAFLESELGMSRFFFAYPYGTFGDRERQAVVRAGYECACGLGGFWGNGYETDRFGLHRFVVRRRYSMREFQTIIRSIIKWPLIIWPWQRSPEINDDQQPV